jgi:hypothetical protein
LHLSRSVENDVMEDGMGCGELGWGWPIPSGGLGLVTVSERANPSAGAGFGAAGRKGCVTVYS